MNPEKPSDPDIDKKSTGSGEKLTSQEKAKIHEAKKAQKNFEAAKMLKVFLKNTKGKTEMQKELLRKALKLHKKRK